MVTSWMVGLMPEQRGWRFGLGLGMVLLGIFSLGFTTAAGLLSVALLGVALLIGGGLALIGVARSDGVAEVLMMIILAAMLLVTGVALIADPLRTLVATTTLLATYLCLSGVARIVIAFFNRRGSWGGGVLHGVVDLLLGVLIWANWPLSGFVAVGFFVGIELILIGVSWIVGARGMQARVSADASPRA